MSTIALVGIDLGKRTFHIHAQDAGGRGKRLAEAVLSWS
jgi:hypothetical protein